MVSNNVFFSGLFLGELNQFGAKRLSFNTLNAYSYCLARRNLKFSNTLQSSDVLLPDGISIVWAVRFLTGKKIRKIAGADLFKWEMERIQKSGGKVFFLGSSPETLEKIVSKAGVDYPAVKISTYSPPFKPEFSEEDNNLMVEKINNVNPDVLFIGMTAPKQEIWAYQHKEQLNCGHICCIGAVFDFYAGTKRRAPKWMIALGLEWLFRFILEPKRMWKRYLVGNTLFVYYILREKFFGS